MLWGKGHWRNVPPACRESTTGRCVSVIRFELTPLTGNTSSSIIHTDIINRISRITLYNFKSYLRLIASFSIFICNERRNLLRGAGLSGAGHFGVRRVAARWRDYLIVV
ncbi:hypothetical protein KCP78_25815 [Salmonella enterica subsp. enterica]|nr:hypothetical protein KCP78_25815 [Salmonella enterica subsp. enterica]